MTFNKFWVLLVFALLYFLFFLKLYHVRSGSSKRRCAAGIIFLRKSNCSSVFEAPQKKLFYI